MVHSNRRMVGAAFHRRPRLAMERQRPPRCPSSWWWSGTNNLAVLSPSRVVRLRLAGHGEIWSIIHVKEGAGELPKLVKEDVTVDGVACKRCSVHYVREGLTILFK